ncbi:uncharacterized protein LOC123656478 [Melitaea cinxia]|uniref:uncharacterized protein LOC123656478 n=1 Tax=Melitaea cinxia TaxID=113334 RepID=UPI001E26F1E3|nr:uncharacterized protein LOC123656478 [Melitaea cinxia]
MDDLKNYENADTISIDTLALEEILQEEREKEISELKTLSKKVCFLHTSLLYYRNPKTKTGAICYEAWKTLIKKVGGSLNTWKDLGYALDISQDDLDYITNSVKEDPADIVIKVFLQNETATLDKILDALVKMNRYDILKAVQEPFSNLSQCFNKEDSGYHSTSKTSGIREIISLTNNLKIDLPPALKKKYVTKDKDQKPKQPSLSPSKKTDNVKVKNDRPILFLTYTEDGLDTAVNIQQYISDWDDINVEIFTLNGRREEVYQNPEKIIREYFEKADFIVPIITSGYLHRIKSHQPQVPSTNDNLDYKYVNYIYNLIINHYIYVTGCLNEKVRSVLPCNANVDVLKEISMYPDLMPWTYESNFEENFKAFLKKD